MFRDQQQDIIMTPEGWAHRECIDDNIDKYQEAELRLDAEIEEAKSRQDYHDSTDYDNLNER